MKAVILAAGRGERLQPFTYTRPKPLIPVLDRPLLHWTIENLAELGIKEIIVTVGYMKEAISEALSKLNAKGLAVKLVDQGRELGTADALEKALRHARSSESILLVYGDVLVDRDSMSIIAKSGGNVIAGVRVSDPSGYGVIRCGSDGTLLGISEKPRRAPPYSLVFAGVALLKTDEVAHYLDKTGFSERGERELTHTLTLMAEGGARVRVLEIPESSWVEVGKPWDILDANRWALTKMAGKGVAKVNGEIEQGVTIRGEGVIVEEGAVVRASTYISGPVYIGRDAEIGPNAYLRPYTVVGRGSKIGFSVEVKSSVIMEHVHASHLAYIGDSVIGEHANLGAGTVIANLRFDGKSVRVRVRDEVVDTKRRKLGAFLGAYVKTGVNVTIYPGVKIGAFSWIYPGAVVMDDVPPKTIYKWPALYELRGMETG